ncbi:hypothetical protein SNOG_06034 [Parastagonospora nodorum SN15]|uniref:LSM complex subunit LSM4 n=1 Tax=Phaeosphaeria nodorum (strain SN15 / ATCC MYA-4574 / FGSC 10173) TaxID=321614 RepID=Q0UQD0_PHANO|nr:hypothetical protein SNOG_06034 [Parastagonospora nodorum SN15]EAT87098.1 hypothetical protein SNOG_06034 [Parastagonospora nodorum SN15]
MSAKHGPSSSAIIRYTTLDQTPHTRCTTPPQLSTSLLGRFSCAIDSTFLPVLQYSLLWQSKSQYGLLTAATGHPMLVELKSGETLNGLLVNCDTWMNLTLREVVQTSADGDKFMRLPEIYVRGSTIKYLRVPDEIVDVVKDQQVKDQANRGGRGGMHQRGEHRGDRGGRGMRGRGRGRGRGGGGGGA